MNATELRQIADEVNRKNAEAAAAEVREQVLRALQECKRAADLGQYTVDLACDVGREAVAELKHLGLDVAFRDPPGQAAPRFRLLW